jgi:hypothetical protein
VRFDTLASFSALEPPFRSTNDDHDGSRVIVRSNKERSDKPCIPDRYTVRLRRQVESRQSSRGEALAVNNRAHRIDARVRAGVRRCDRDIDDASSIRSEHGCRNERTHRIAFEDADERCGFVRTQTLGDDRSLLVNEDRFGRNGERNTSRRFVWASRARDASRTRCDRKADESRC